MEHRRPDPSCDRPGPGRPREFVIEEAVRDAVEAFRRHGYHGTSVQDLMKGTGLAKGSLYKAFGDKRSLFLAALDQYMSASLQRIAQSLREPGPARAVIGEALRAYARRVAESNGGCLITIALMELVPEDAEVARMVERMFRRLQDLFAAAVIRGQAAGEIPQERDERAIARALLCTMQGLRILAKTKPAEAEIAGIIDLALRALD